MINKKSKIKSINLASKWINFYFGIIMSMGLFSCAKKVIAPSVIYTDNVANYTSEVTIDTKVNTDSYILLTNGDGLTTDEAITQSEKNAFSVLLFNGIANSDLNIPLVENERQSISSHQEFYDNFFKKFDFRKFITQHSIISQSPSPGGRIQVKMRITINLGNLKMYLIQNSIIRKFGL